MKRKYNLIRNWVVVIAVLSIAIKTGAADGFKMAFPSHLLDKNSFVTQSNNAKQAIKIISGVGHIKLQNLETNDHISFYDLQGLVVAKTVPRTSEYIIDMNSGVYLVEVNNQYTTKTIVY